MTRSMLRLHPLPEKAKMMIRMVNLLKKSKIASVKIDAMRIDPRIEMVNAVVTAKIAMIVIAKAAKNVIVIVTVVMIVVAMTRSAKSETGAVTIPNAIKTVKKIAKRTTKVAVKSAESCSNTQIE